jgi:hypothetical protein
MITGDIFVHRLFLFGVWLVNGALLYVALTRLHRPVRILAVGVFLASAFVLQSYALHTEIFILTAFLVCLVAIARPSSATPFIVGLTASATLFIKPLGPLVFVPALCYVLTSQCFARRWSLLIAGVAVPIVAVFGYLAAAGTISGFIQQVVLDNRHVGLSLGTDVMGYLTLAVVPLLVPLFGAVLAVDRRVSDLEWVLAVGLFIGLLALELLRGARHYGLLNLCVLAWMAFRAQSQLNVRARGHRLAAAALVTAAAIFHALTVREILVRGTITDELAAAAFAKSLPPGSLQVFANSSPRLYMLLHELPPAYRYVFVYDTNRDLVNWDSYRSMMTEAPPDYIAVEDTFTAVEYGSTRSSELTSARAVRNWVERHGGYRQLEGGHMLGLSMYQRLSLATGEPRGQGGT